MFEKLLKTLESQGRFHIIKDRENQTEYLRRWYVGFPDSIHREREDIPFNTFIHQFMRNDDDVYHTHPWEWFHSTILEGGYWEHTPWGTTWYGAGDQRYVDCCAWKELDGIILPSNLHWVEILEPGKTWTLFTRGPSKPVDALGRKFWGFCPDLKTGEIIYHEDYLNAHSGYYKNDNTSPSAMG